MENHDAFAVVERKSYRLLCPSRFAMQKGSIKELITDVRHFAIAAQIVTL